jgi:hypothetical protein
MRTGIYRVRKTWFGRCILQELHHYPTAIGSSEDSSIRIPIWKDIKWNMAPGLLKQTHDFDKLYEEPK